MDSDGKFWLGAWSIAALTVVALVMAVNFWISRTDTKIIDMVKAGATPEAAYCALRGMQEPTCASRRAK